MKLTGKIAKADVDEHLVFGWASVTADEDGATIVDSDGDTIQISELERAAYEFVLFSREGGEMHERTGVAALVESMVFTPQKLAALGLPEKSLPSGWWIGMKVFDNDVWQKIKDGTYSMFSIGGRAIREEIKEVIVDESTQRYFGK